MGLQGCGGKGGREREGEEGEVGTAIPEAVPLTHPRSWE